MAGLAPLLYGVYFSGTGPHAASYRRLARVFGYSVRQTTPGWEVCIDALPAPENPADKPLGHWMLSNTVKLQAWKARVDEAPDGRLILLSDVDMLSLDSLAPLEAIPFDLAYTIRQGPLAFNAGVIAVRASAVSREFFRLWETINRTFLYHPEIHKPYRQRYGGINQAALGKCLEDGIPEAIGLHVCQLPGLEWNAEQTCWRDVRPGSTRLLHIKSHLRAAVLYGRAPRATGPRSSRGHIHRRRVIRPRPRSVSPQSTLVALAARWHTLERAMLGQSPKGDTYVTP